MGVEPQHRAAVKRRAGRLDGSGINQGKQVGYMGSDCRSHAGWCSVEIHSWETYASRQYCLQVS